MHPSLIIMLAAWAFVLVWTTGVIASQRRHHPRALFHLFVVELWERFSYYGMRALLIFYLTKQFVFSDDKAYGIYGAYGALVYAAPVIGGLLADRLLGLRNAITLGAVLMAVGHACMAVSLEPVMYLALGFLIVGNGFFKPNISSLIGGLYEDNDGRRDSAYTLFYMGINTGGFLAPLTCGTIGELYGWHYGFGLAGVGMLCGLLIFTLSGRRGIFGDKGRAPRPELLSRRLAGVLPFGLVFGSAIVLSVALMAMLVAFNGAARWLLLALGLTMLGYVFIHALREEKIQRERLMVILVLFVFTVLFWTFFELAGSSIALFTDRHVDRRLLGHSLPASLFQAVNPLFILALAPLFAGLWERLGRSGREISAPLKFALGLLQLGGGFAILAIGTHLADAAALTPLVMLIAAYLLHTTGELCLSPIGLSLVSRLAPRHMVAFIMGIWLMSSSFAHTIGAEVSKLTSQPLAGEAEPVGGIESLRRYGEVFGMIAVIAMAAGLLLWALAPLIRRWMHEREEVLASRPVRLGDTDG